MPGPAVTLPLPVQPLYHDALHHLDLLPHSLDVVLTLLEAPVQLLSDVLLPVQAPDVQLVQAWAGARNEPEHGHGHGHGEDFS